jgi:small subunit ribosomal protein S16
LGKQHKGGDNGVLRIRMQRLGRRQHPQYRLVVADARKKRQGDHLERLGHYDPRKKDPKEKMSLDLARFRHWVQRGAQPSEAVLRLLRHAGMDLRAKAAPGAPEAPAGKQ